MKTSDFVEPTGHPADMLNGYENAYQKECTLVFVLSECIKIGSFAAVETEYEHPTMVEDGLLERVGERKYKLTKKSIGLLYSHYAS